MPPSPLQPDHAQGVAALVGSTDQPAVPSSDINGFLRTLGVGNHEALAMYRKSVCSLNDEVRKHLALAGALLKDLRGARAARAKSNPPSARTASRS